MTQIENELLGALKALREVALTMTSGKLHSGEDMENFQLALNRTNRVIKLAENAK
jgi:hypothetical protein